MSTEAVVSGDLSRVRWVTAHYWEMQGLRRALVGVVAAVVVGGLVLAGPDPVPDRTAVGATLVAFGLIALGMLWLDRYYARVFGRLTPNAAARLAVWILPSILVALSWLHPLVGAPPYGLIFLGWGAFRAWAAWRDWPLRRHLLLDAAAGIAAAALQWQAAASGEPTTGFLWGLVLVGTAGALTGLQDHRVLADTLRPGTREHHRAVPGADRQAPEPPREPSR